MSLALLKALYPAEPRRVVEPPPAEEIAAAILEIEALERRRAALAREIHDKLDAAEARGMDRRAIRRVIRRRLNARLVTPDDVAAAAIEATKGA